MHRALSTLVLLVAWGMAGPASAQGGGGDAAAICEFRDRLAEEIFRSIERGVTIGQDAGASLDAVTALTAKATKPNVPLDQQLGAPDVAAFKAAQQKLAILQSLQLIERRRQRDLQALNRMIATADRSFRFGLDPPADGQAEDLARSALKLIRGPLEEKSLDVASGPNECTLESSIVGLKAEIWLKVGRYDLAKVKELGEQLQKKYSLTGAIDRDKLSPEDRKLWDIVVKEIVIPAERARNFLFDLEASHTALRASDVIYASDRSDVQTFSGDPDRMGLSIKKKVEAQEFEKPLVTAIGVWRMANENENIR